MPGPKCIIRNCHKVKRSSKDARLAFHKFPRDSVVKKKWFKKLGIEDPSLEYGFVCSRHFKIEDYVRDLQAELLGYIGRRKLKPYAVPSLNLPNGSIEISQEEKERVQREKHEKIIRDCLNESGQNKTILSFDLFKKLRYSNSRTRKSKSNSPSRWYSDENPEDSGYNINPRESFDLDDDNSQMIVVKLPTGEKHYVNIETLQDPLRSIKQEDTTYEIDSVEDMHAEEEFSMDDALDEPMYLRRKVRKLEAEVQEQKKEICTLRRQIIREKKMMEKIVLATNSGKTWPIANKKRFDAKSRSALLDIYSLAPNKYPSFSRILNLPAKQVLASWDPKICHPSEQDSSQKEVPEEIAEDDFQEQDFVEEEYVIESEEYVQE